MNTRFAPSPTSQLIKDESGKVIGSTGIHIGGIRTAYFNWLAARATGGSFLLRIDDSSIERSNKESEVDILKALEWLGINYDKMVHQSDYFEDYRDKAKSLGKLIIQEENGGIRLNLTENDRSILPREWEDEISGKLNVSDKNWEYFKGLPLIKADGSPTYNFATVVDEIRFKIDYIQRGLDILSSSPVQLGLYNILGAKPPKFCHLGLICVKGKPMSKRDGDANILGYKDKGVDPDAMLNFLIRMGWGPKGIDSNDLIPKETAIKMFISGGTRKNSPANLDLHILKSFDRKYKTLKTLKTLKKDKEDKNA